MPTPSGPDDEGMLLPVVSRRGSPYHLPCVVDPVSLATVPTECAEVGHASSERLSDPPPKITTRVISVFSIFQYSYESADHTCGGAKKPKFCNYMKGNG
ncbi:hypothetical protein C8R31_101802 [Nitrosospira sp. Nsp2]|nr:hypothetical protein C8R31_101802 [Nitrosospira sp. Nsp2]